MIGNNQIFNWCFQKLWNWGTTTTYRDPKSPNFGGPVPIWRNDYKLFFGIFSGLNFLIFLFDFLSYIISLSNVKSAADLCFDLSDSIFLQMIFSMFNCKRFVNVFIGWFYIYKGWQYFSLKKAKCNWSRMEQIFCIYDGWLRNAVYWSYYLINFGTIHFIFF